MNRRVKFGSTLWSLIERARAGDRAACDRIFNQYRPAVVNFAAMRGLSDHDAEDLAQEVMIRLERALSSVDPDKGRFRSLVLAITKNLLKREWHRRSRTSPVSLDSKDDGAPPDLPSPEARDQAFDSMWVDNLVCMAMEDLRTRCEEKGTPHYRALYSFANEGAAYAEIARKMNKSVADVKGYIYLARQHIKRFVKTAIAEYSLSDEYEEEAAYLMKFLGE
jgi:RNA polymerase sigma-70 factor (ECF subfamily)